MAFRDLREFLDEGLDLPIGGVTYHVAPPSAAKGLYLQRLRDITSMREAGIDLTEAQANDLKIDDDHEIDFYRDNLGDAHDEMLAGGVTVREIRVAAAAAFICWTSQGDGRADAEAYWEAQQPDPRPAPTVKKKPKKAAKGSASTVGASMTHSVDSGSGTSSQRAKSRAPKAERALRSAS